MSSSRVKFATQIDGALLDEVRALAKKERRQIQSIIEDALENLLEDRHQGKVRPRVMRAYRTSHARFSSLYEKLVSRVLLPNGIALTADSDSTRHFLSRLHREGEFQYERLDEWLRENTRPAR